MSTSRSDDVYMDEPYLFIRWDREHKCVYVAFKSFATSVEFRAGTIKVIEAIQDRHAVALVSDNRKLEGISDSDQLWLRDTWTPMAEAAGIKRVAVVLAHQGLGKFVSELIISNLGETEFVTRTFESLSDANTWVASDKP
jgi:hypothetical protein